MAPRARDRIVRLSDVAKAAGVSQGTVSNVFNHPDLVRAEVLARVKDIARDLGYQGPDPRGRLLRAGKVNAIGVATAKPISHFFTDPYARALLAEISRACEATGTGISLVSTLNEEALSWNMRNALVDGFILFCLAGAERLIAHSQERFLPFIVLAFDDAESHLPVIDVDNVAGGHKAAAHLADLGHRRFAILAIEFNEGCAGRRTPDDIACASLPSGRDRARGSLDELAMRGIPPDTVPIFECIEDGKSVHAALQTLFEGDGPKPTALIAQSDAIAMIALDWLAARGLSVPEDVSIIGFDGVPEAALTRPPLTTIAQPIAEISRRAVRAIAEHNSSDTKPVRDLLDTELILRGSTAPPKGQPATA